MSLSASLSSANSSLYVAGERTSVVSRNIANADRAFYTRKSVEVGDDAGLRRQDFGCHARRRPRSLPQSPRLRLVVGDARGHSGFARSSQCDDQRRRTRLVAGCVSINSLTSALQSYSAQPHSQLAAEAAVRSARDLANSLNSSAATVQQVRNDADLGIQSSVDRINSLLEQFQGVNAQIVKGTITGADVTDYMDQRDEILASLSNEIGVRTVTRGNNDMSIYTDSGVTLFDRSPRAVDIPADLELDARRAGQRRFHRRRAGNRRQRHHAAAVGPARRPRASA